MEEMWNEINILKERLKASEDNNNRLSRKSEYQQKELDDLTHIINDVNLIKVCEMLKQR